eukprot:SAG22_NODE_3532_length_1657_cov_1.340180_2_plen_93_part_00
MVRKIVLKDADQVSGFTHRSVHVPVCVTPSSAASIPITGLGSTSSCAESVLSWPTDPGGGSQEELQAWGGWDDDSDSIADAMMGRPGSAEVS